MLGSLFSPLETRLPFPPWFLPSFLATGVVSCLPPPRWKFLRVAVGAPVFTALLLRAPKYTSGEVAFDFVIGIFTTSIVFKWLDIAILRDTDRSFWRVPDLRQPWGSVKFSPENPIKVMEEGYSPSNGQILNENSMKDHSKAAGAVSTLETTDAETPDPNAPISPRANGSWWERLRWSLSLWSTTRGVGWNWMVSNVPESVPPGYPKLKFLRHTIHHFLFSYLALDFVHACTNWYTATKGGVLPNVFAEPVAIRTAVAWFAAFETYNALQWPYYLVATITTVLGICRPEQWPNLMGSFGENMWSVRQFWAKCWHTELRRTVTEPAKAAVDFFGLPKGSMLRKYTQLYISFSISAIVHHAGAYLVGRDTGGMYYLWLGQASIIMLEDLVIHTGKRMGIKDNAYLRALGKLWVCLWFCLPTNFPTGAAVVVNQGMGNDPLPLNFSLSALFPIAAKCSDSLFKVVADRGLIFWMLSKALSIIEAKNLRDILEAAAGASGAMFVKYYR